MIHFLHQCNHKKLVGYFPFFSSFLSAVISLCTSVCLHWLIHFLLFLFHIYSPPPQGAAGEKDDCLRERPKLSVKFFLQASVDIAAKFLYDQVLVEAFCKIPKASWNLKESLWMFPISSLLSAEKVLREISSLNVEVFFGLSMTAMGISQSGALAPDTSKAKSAAASVFAIIDHKSKIDSSDDSGMTLENLEGEIEFRQVCFKYPARPDIQIFSDLCLTIKAGKTLALVGESGSGKSTVISLLQRFYDPDSGQIALDGIEIQRLNLKWLRQQMGVVSQEPNFFNETIRANIHMENQMMAIILQQRQKLWHHQNWQVLILSSVAYSRGMTQWLGRKGSNCQVDRSNEWRLPVLS